MTDVIPQSYPSATATTSPTIGVAGSVTVNEPPTVSVIIPSAADAV